MELEADVALMTDSDAENVWWGGTTRGRTLLKSDSGFYMKFCGRSKPVIHYPIFITTKEKTSQVGLFSKWISHFPFVHALPTQLTYAHPGNGTKNACWYFITSTSETGLFSLVPVKLQKCPASAPTNASTFYIAITDNQTNETWIIPQVDEITGAAFYPVSILGCHL